MFRTGKLGNGFLLWNHSFSTKGQGKDTIRVKNARCNALVTITEDTGSRIAAHGYCKHNLQNNTKAIKNIVYIKRLREEVKDERNNYVRTETVVSSVRNETLTCRRKSADYRLARRIRMRDSIRAGQRSSL